MKIIVDADACPKNVLLYALKVGKNKNIQVVTVASFNHEIESDLHVTVGNASQEADIKVINLTEKGDIVITQDWGLAAMVLSRKAYAINPIGIEYFSNKMDFMLEERNMKAEFRKSGGKTKGPAKRKNEDDKRFFKVFDEIISRIS